MTALSAHINYLFIVNPISGDVDKAELIEAVKRKAAIHKIFLSILETDGKNDMERIRKIYAEIEPQRVLVAGGDGTIKLAAEALEDQDVVFGILPAGSANGLSVDLDLPQDMDEVLEIAFNGPSRSLDMVCINNHKSLHLSDIGLNAGLVKNYEQSNIRGKLGYALQSITTLQQDSDPFQVTVTASGQTISCEARMVVIANSQKYGTGVVINPEGDMSDGKFEIVILKTFDLVLLGKIVTGNMPLETGEIEIYSTDKARIETAAPVHFQVDGEYIGEETSLDIYVLPAALRVAVSP